MSSLEMFSANRSPKPFAVKILRVESVMPNMSVCCIGSLSCPNGLKLVSFIPGIPLALKISEVFLGGLILGSILDGLSGEPLL
jgi:hypothetical protein